MNAGEQVLVVRQPPPNSRVVVTLLNLNVTYASEGKMRHDRKRARRVDQAQQGVRFR